MAGAHETQPTPPRRSREDHTAKEETLHVRLHEALADETAAKARAAQAEADVKAAQASGLQQQAAVHRNEAASSRDQLNEQWDRANELDPASSTPDMPKSADHN